MESSQIDFNPLYWYSSPMKLYYAVVFSLIFHFFFYLTSNELASHFDAAKEEKIEIVLLQNDEPYKLIRDLEVPKPDSLLPSLTTNVSDKNQQFNKQQRAKEFDQDQTVNRSSVTSEEELQKEFIKKLETISKLSNEVIRQLKEERKFRAKHDYNPNLFRPDAAPSTVNDPFTNVPIGSFTALNTNRYLYYSFFARIEDQFRQRWVSGINRVRSRRPTIRRSDRDKDVWTTEIEILLDQKGAFVRADIHRSSGLDGLDYAALEAFRKSAPFLNPPKGLVNKDGFILLRYAMSVYWKPEYYRN